ncbi:MAG: YIP1 family protein [Patescibacteria group bacterium]
MLVELLQSGFSFFRHVKGIIVSPYETYRDIEKRGRTGELLYIGLLVGLYFFFSSIVKTASFHPLLLSRVAFVLFVAALSGFGLMVSLFVVVGRSLGTKASIERLSLLWGYTLIPTVVWFLFTSFLYVLIPPPRTTAFTGVSLSVVYLVVSAMIFWWKLTLSYLTLRFGLKLDFGKICIIALVSVPVLLLWSYLLYILGIYKVPFL